MCGCIASTFRSLFFGTAKIFFQFLDVAMFSSPSTLVKVFGPRSKLHNRNTTCDLFHGDGKRQLDDQGTSPTGQADPAGNTNGDPSPRPGAPDNTLSSSVARSRKLVARDGPLPCNADNQLRALLRFSTEAKDFCAAYLATVFSNSRPLPTYISQYNSVELSSACSCFQLTNGCCTSTSGNAGRTSSVGTPATAQLTLSQVPEPASALPQTQRPSSTADPATEDSTFSRPLEYSGPLPTSEATITALPQGPTSVPLLSKSTYPMDLRLHK